jgi:type IV secretory pathway TrbD component
MTEPRKVPIHAALTRPLLLAGAERELVLVNVVTIAALVFGIGWHWATMSAAIFLATVGQWLLVQAAKIDPQLSRIYKRHLTYKPFYQAQASIDAPISPVHPTVKPTMTYV